MTAFEGADRNIPDFNLELHFILFAFWFSSIFMPENSFVYFHLFCFYWTRTAESQIAFPLLITNTCVKKSFM